MPPQQIPSVAFLYTGANKLTTPQVQAGFLYKARNYSNNNNNKDSYPVSATMYPIYNRAVSENKVPVKYQPIYAHKPQAVLKVKQYSPFSPSNKIPGQWLPINYKHYYTKGSVYEDPQKEFIR
jgi:hypothetical protein